MAPVRVLLFLAGCALFGTGIGGENGPMMQADAYLIGPSSPRVRRPLSATEMPGEKKFVQVRITEVHNPGRVPLMFSVYFQRDGEGEHLLGTFSLFPPDNPGTFIVATQGKLKRGDTLLLEMEPLADTFANTDVRVRIGRIELTDTLERAD